MKIKSHTIHIAILIIILAIGLYLFLAFSGNPFEQLLISTFTSLAYAVWGIMYHWLEGNLHKKIVVEYILICTMAIIISYIVLSS